MSRDQPRFKGPLFHPFLIVCALFRFGHEFVRDTPRYTVGVSPYQVLALAVAALGVWRHVTRAKTLDTIDAVTI